MTKSRPEADDLDDMLHRMAADVPDVPNDLMARVLGDAYDAQPVDVVHAAEKPEARGWHNVLSVFGGWGGLGGLAFAASVGFVIGLSPPEMVTTPLNEMLGEDLMELYDSVPDDLGFGWELEEG